MKERKKQMSVDYSSVLIYGFKISAEEVKRFKEEHSEDEFCCIIDELDSHERYRLIRENDYIAKSDYYFGITLSSEIEIDSIDAICWFEYESDLMKEEFERAFGSISYVDIDKPMMYHFVRVW